MKRIVSCYVIIVLLCSAATASAASITKQEVLNAQEEWGEAIVNIGKAYQQHKDYKSVAIQAIDSLYAYGLKDVIFKPTKATEQQFRPDRKSALSYFVGGAINEDSGFALHPWSKVRFVDQIIVLNDCDAIAQGNYYFTDAKTGQEVKVEFTFGYIKDDKGKLRIFLHHSSLPYEPNH